MKLDESPEEGLKSVLATQKKEANELFGRFISAEYEHWFASEEDRPMLSHELVNRVVAPQLRDGHKVFLCGDGQLEVGPVVGDQAGLGAVFPDQEGRHLQQYFALGHAVCAKCVVRRKDARAD